VLESGVMPLALLEKKIDAWSRKITTNAVKQGLRIKIAHLFYFYTLLSLPHKLVQTHLLPPH
jgi:hypothetical protein